IREETLADIFAATARQYPDKTALIFQDEELTWSALDAWANRIAAYLMKKGIGRNDAVGIGGQRGLELHAAILGIVKAGAAYVPIDRETPAGRVETILEEVGAAGYFSTEQLN